MSNITELEKLYTAIDEKLSKGYEMTRKYLGIDPDENIQYFAVNAVCKRYNGEHLLNLACASQCFLWFRYLHSELLMNNTKTDNIDFMERATLLGDYFFSQFSLHLIPIDSTPLIDEFSDFLRRETENSHSNGSSDKQALDMNKYADFFTNIFEVLE